MHIMEGFLPPAHAAAWTLAAAPFLGVGLWRLKAKATSENRLYYGLSAAWCCVLSALKLPSVAGSSSHPTGTGLGTAFFGPWEMTVFSALVLLFQALFLAHGGITTLGANLMSMGVAGPWCGWMALRLCLALRIRVAGAVFACGLASNFCTYIVTSLQLALAFPDPSSGFWGAFLKFGGLFSLTQIPLAMAEGIFTAIAFQAVLRSGSSATNGFAPWFRKLKEAS